MKPMILRRALASAALLVSLELGGFPGSLPLVRGEVVSNNSTPILLQAPAIEFVPPPEDEDPPDTASGGTRGSCDSTNSGSAEAMAALIPETNGGLTLKSHPTFFIVPPASARGILFTLRDEGDRIRYQKIVPLSEAQGAIGIDLPESEAALEIGKTYQWFAIALCHYDPEGQQAESEVIYTLNDPWVQGWVRRVEPNAALSHQMEREPSLELAALYAKNGIWFDTLALLAELRRQQPQNSAWAREWTALLNSVGLEAIATQPLVE
ncbi:MAG TPA: DUF928 domain-containing protein [Oscillatoriales cyanobacterium M59_W2019_021]|nr:MAG: DUF928 domain-containing protein [Cyanobacteria bacterium J055]HIK33077.1 DUF928 domain-containing protein [Oscillatoriales cyanobacterium M4454_W2019_049]HIK53022.1 DUF928 domain-containing protein [Oscillatoriales cyanobacterium M59_W2019_021]